MIVYVVMRLCEWRNLAMDVQHVGGAVPARFAPAAEWPEYYLPAFARREDAEAWRNDGQYAVVRMGVEEREDAG